MKTPCTRSLGGWSGAAVCGVVLALAAGCHDSNTGSKAFSHQDVVLLDRLGAPIAVGSTEPYSPRQTCGACHDVDEIANGYHFQQGRTDANGDLIVQDDFFGDGRTYVRSPGMYGKW